jgi:hypothetical protein
MRRMKHSVGIALRVLLISAAVLPARADGQTCVQVTLNGQKPPAYNCLNQQMQSLALGAQAAPPALPVTANAPSNQVGTFNQQGIAEQYGQNFGKSVIPYRPPAPVMGGGSLRP